MYERRERTTVDMRRHPDLSVSEKRRFGKSPQTCAEALRRFRAGSSQAEIARWLKLSPLQVRYMLMQERVEDGEVSAVAPTTSAIGKALEDGGEFGSSAWVACRPGVVENYVVRARSESPG
jgi:hypothetical protein